jgi:hypothetical protein
MSSPELTRGQLYELVWSIPLSKLAARYGISNVALAKKCRKHAVPTPGVGYWAKLAAGQDPERPGLPSTPHGVPYQIVMDHTPPTPQELRQPPPEVKVPPRLVEPHPVVKWLQDQLTDAKPDKYGRLVVGYESYPDVCIRRSCVSRALVLLDALFKTLVARGHDVQLKRRHEHSPYPDMMVLLLGEEIPVEIEEKLARRPHVLTKEEHQQARSNLYGIPKYDYYPDSELIIRLKGVHYCYRGQQSWSDTKTRRLDDLLGHAVRAIEEAASAQRLERLEEQRKKEEELAEKRRRVRGKRLKWYREWLTEDLERMARSWKRSRTVINFLAAYERALPAAEGRSDPVSAWLEMAHHDAANLDPLNDMDSVAKELEPSDEALAELWKQYGPDETKGQRWPEPPRPRGV